MALALAIALLGFTAVAAEQESLRTTMHGVLDRLGAILPMALGDEPLSDSERLVFESRLEELMVAAQRIQTHGSTRDAGFRYLGRSLNDDLRGVQRSWERGEEDSARYFLVNATANCVACHSRLPAHAAPSLAAALEPAVTSPTASAHERAQLLVATRQFTRALDVWERSFSDLEMTASELDFGGYLLDYLTIAVRVERDLARPIPHLKALAARPGTPRYLQAHLARWVNQLQRFSEQSEPIDRLAAARTLCEDADFGFGRERLVADLQASGWLLQVIEAGGDDPAMAEAFYWLGVLENRNVEGYWVPQTDVHLEASVRLDPGGPFAGEAYDQLEEYLISGYAGIQGSELPPDLHARLAELIDLMADADAAKAAEDAPNAAAE